MSYSIIKCHIFNVVYIGDIHGIGNISGGTFAGTEAGAAVRVPDGTTVESIFGHSYLERLGANVPDRRKYRNKYLYLRLKSIQKNGKTQTDVYKGTNV